MICADGRDVYWKLAPKSDPTTNKIAWIEILVFEILKRSEPWVLVTGKSRTILSDYKIPNVPNGNSSEASFKKIDAFFEDIILSGMKNLWYLYRYLITQA